MTRKKNAPAAVKRSGRLYQQSYLLAAAVEDFLLCFLPECLCVDFAGAEAPEAAGVPAAGASAAMEAAAKPKVNRAVVIRVADFFMRSPNVVWA
jgi:hypothetical protein